MLKILDRISAPSFKVRSWFEFVVVCVRVCVRVFETHEMLSKRAHSKCKDICIESGGNAHFIDSNISCFRILALKLFHKHFDKMYHSIKIA